MFCLNYYPSQTYIREADQLKIKYRPADRTLEDFLEEYKDKSIVIDVSDSFEQTDAKLFSVLCQKYKNIKLIIDFNKDEQLKMVQDYKIPFFFSSFVSTIDQMWGLLAYKPTDMYICEELGFSLDKINKILHENNIKIRVFPNICQSSFSKTPSLKTFFIRPEDIDIYSVFVDVFELVSDKERQRVLFKIYRGEKWFGKISEIIPTFKNDLDSRYIISSFGVIRSQCGKRCLYKPGTCNICDRLTDLAETFKNGGIVVQRNKIKEES